MKKLAAILGMALVTLAANAAVIHTPGAFESDTIGNAPNDWVDETGGGVYSVENSYTFTAPQSAILGPAVQVPYYGGNQFVTMTLDGSGSYILSKQYYLNPGDSIKGFFAYDSDDNLPAATVFVRLYRPNNSTAHTSLLPSPDAESWSLWTLGGDLTKVPVAGWYTVKLTVGEDFIDGSGGVVLFDVAEVPEAKGWMMGGALLGIFGIGALIRRRQQAKAVA